MILVSETHGDYTAPTSAGHDPVDLLRILNVNTAPLWNDGSLGVRLALGARRGIKLGSYCPPLTMDFIYFSTAWLSLCSLRLSHLLFLSL